MKKNRWTIYRFVNTPNGRPSDWHVTDQDGYRHPKAECVDVMPVEEWKPTDRDQASQVLDAFHASHPPRRASDYPLVTNGCPLCDQEQALELHASLVHAIAVVYEQLDKSDWPGEALNEALTKWGGRE